MKHKNTEPQYNEHWQFEWLKTTAGGKKVYLLWTATTLMNILNIY